jgi:putative membrane protein insertion efficiency factor
MSKFFTFIIINIIKIYKYLISPFLGNRCRYFLTCSDYFIDALKIHGLIKGLYFGIKRILSCHPIESLGGGSSVDLVYNKKNTNKEKI